jgi:DNA-binding phage protein
MMPNISREQLDCYLDDALSESETAQIEQALRESEALRRRLRALMQERDRGDHSIGAIWRREHLSCPTREQLGSYFLQVLDEDQQDYIRFHLEVIGCSSCLANKADLEASLHESPPRTQERRRRYFESSAGYLRTCRDK